jgi:uncharacterized membrane protein
MKKKLIPIALITLAVAGVVFMFYKKNLQNKVMKYYNISEYQVGEKSLSDLRKMIAAYEANEKNKSDNS